MPKAMVEAEFLDASEAARLLSLSRWTVYSMAAKGDLPSYRLPRSRALRFRLADLRALFQRRDPSEVSAVVSDAVGASD